jgi:GLPGLI family protein
MKQTAIRILFLFFTTLLNAQEKQGIINYSYIKSLHIGNKNGDEFNAQLLFNNNQSYFVTEKDSLEINFNHNEQIQNNQLGSEENSTNEIKTIGNSSFLTTHTGSQVFYDRKKDSIWSFLRNPKNMYIAEKRPDIKWIFTKETKKIGTLVCHSATTNFRGRQYTVWYTPEIPLPYGPWKFTGLPGLVLEAYDTDFFVYFYFKNIEYPLKKEIKINFIKESPDSEFLKWYTYDDYLKIAKLDIESDFEKMLIVAKDLGTFTPIKPEMNKRYIEIAE